MSNQQTPTPRGRYVASARRAAPTSTDVDWRQLLINTEGVTIIGSTRHMVTFEATEEIFERLRALLGNSCLVERVVERRIPQ